MKNAKVLLAFIMLLIVAISAANAAQQVTRPGKSIESMVCV
jgi:hypothetical protein